MGKVGLNRREEEMTGIVRTQPHQARARIMPTVVHTHQGDQWNFLSFVQVAFRNAFLSHLPVAHYTLMAVFVLLVQVWNLVRFERYTKVKDMSRGLYDFHVYVEDGLKCLV